MSNVCHCRLKWCHTDLGANAYKWPKLIQEDHRFSQLGPVACGLPAEHYDGVMVHRLVDAGWRVEHVQDKCLYDHSPSPQVDTGVSVLSRLVPRILGCEQWPVLTAEHWTNVLICFLMLLAGKREHMQDQCLQAYSPSLPASPV